MNNSTMIAIMWLAVSAAIIAVVVIVQNGWGLFAFTIPFLVTLMITIPPKKDEGVK